MDKKLVYALMLVFNIAAMFVITSAPVHALITHGTTSSWDRGDMYQFNYAWAGWNTSTGNINTLATNGWCYAYMNSAAVQADADVDSITVTIWWSTSTCYSPGFYATGYWECRLYVNGNYKGLQTTDSISGSNGYVQLTFSAPGTQEYDYLDIDLKAFASCTDPEQMAERCALITYIGFTT